MESSVFLVNSQYLLQQQQFKYLLQQQQRRITIRRRSSSIKYSSLNRFGLSQKGLSTIPCNSTSDKSRTLSSMGRTSKVEDVEMECIGTGNNVECTATETKTAADQEKLLNSSSFTTTETELEDNVFAAILDTFVLISPFFFWGTAMVAMKDVLPKTGPFFVATVRLIPSGILLIMYALYKGRKFPSGFMPWFAIAVFGLVDAGCFQGFLAKGLLKTTAGLGSVIIDSQPLTVAVLASILFGESISTVGVIGLIVGLFGLFLLEGGAVDEHLSSLWGSGEWFMLLAAQSMAVGTILVRWVSKYSDPIMATGWHMVIGGLPLLGLAIIEHDPGFTGKIQELNYSDWLALIYTSVFGSALSYGLYFYNATRGSLTRLSSLTFLTPMFASIFGFFFLGETFSSIQILGALITIFGIYLVNTH
eukprot:TRINITY_DN31580_c0_g1_i1.p1 TRINITY_DN31580_c0_g1~~TRINITY_DN31580_c0_g1_i1.p1  ORF type:complete len:419 (+),score=67.58 TRINITY_DN31580_c0_g1_i1:212-1468(+)